MLKINYQEWRPIIPIKQPKSASDHLSNVKYVRKTFVKICSGDIWNANTKCQILKNPTSMLSWQFWSQSFGGTIATFVNSVKCFGAKFGRKDIKWAPNINSMKNSWWGLKMNKTQKHQIRKPHKKQLTTRWKIRKSRNRQWKWENDVFDHLYYDDDDNNDYNDYHDYHDYHDNHDSDDC
jgi:hypothetical protein